MAQFLSIFSKVVACRDSNSEVYFAEISIQPSTTRQPCEPACCTRRVMGLVDPSPSLCAIAGIEPYGPCRYVVASVIHVSMSLGFTLLFPKRAWHLAAFYVAYQLVDFAINNDTLLLNLGEYGVGAAIGWYWIQRASLGPSPRKRAPVARPNPRDSSADETCWGPNGREEYSWKHPAALYRAVDHDFDMEEAEFLLDQGADPDRGEHGDSPLVAACSVGPLHGSSKRALKMIELLLERGADVNLPCGCGTALGAAAFCGNIDAVTILLEHGADVNLQDAAGTSALHSVMQGMRGWVQASRSIYETYRCVAKRLIGHGAALDAKDEAGHTAHDVVWDCPRDMCELGKEFLEEMSGLTRVLT